MEAEEGDLVWVRTDEQRIQARVLHERKRHRILKLADGSYAKTVINSHRVRRGEETTEEIQRWTGRIHLVRDTLPTLRHEGILRMLGTCRDGYGDDGYVCEPLEMHTYDGSVHPRTRTIGEFLHACYRLASAAGYLHDRGLVHSDITPNNVGFRGEIPVLLDFEALTFDGRRTPWETPEVAGDGRRWLVCTPVCASPEQLLDHPVCPYSDVYCLGLTMLSWVSGYVGVQIPGEDDRAGSLSRCANGIYPHWVLVEQRLNNDRVVDLLSKAIIRCTFDRYVDGNAFARAISNVLHELPNDVLMQPILDAPPVREWGTSVLPSVSTIAIHHPPLEEGKRT